MKAIMADEVILDSVLETYYAPSESDPDTIYEVKYGVGKFQGLKAYYWTCSCPHFQNKLKYYGTKCKHILNFSEEENNDGNKKGGNTKKSQASRKDGREVGTLTKLGSKNSRSK